MDEESQDSQTHTIVGSVSSNLTCNSASRAFIDLALTKKIEKETRLKARNYSDVVQSLNQIIQIGVDNAYS